MNLVTPTQAYPLADLTTQTPVLRWCLARSRLVGTIPAIWLSSSAKAQSRVALLKPAWT